MRISNAHELSMVSEGGYQYSLSMIPPSYEAEMKTIFNDIEKGSLNFHFSGMSVTNYQSDYIMHVMKGVMSEYCSSIDNAVLLANVNFHLTRLTTTIELPLFASKFPDSVFILGFVTIGGSSPSSITYTTHFCPNPDGKYLSFDRNVNNGMIISVPSFRKFPDLPEIEAQLSPDHLASIDSDNNVLPEPIREMNAKILNAMENKMKSLVTPSSYDDVVTAITKVIPQYLHEICKALEENKK